MIAPSANPSKTGWDMEQVKKDNKELDSYSRQFVKVLNLSQPNKKI
jgi:hypothetical protein